MNTSSHIVPTNRIVITYDGLAHKQAIRAKEHESRSEPAKVGFTILDLAHIALYVPASGERLQIALRDISDIQLSRPTSTEPLWRVWLWFDGSFDESNYFTTKESAEAILRSWLDQ
jgi:hypothetical protein